MNRQIIVLLFFIFSLSLQCSDSVNPAEHKIPIGNWRFIDSPLFNYLVLFKDNTFLYAEGGGIVESPEEDGLELGTYSYNQENENISFNITYDDNYPGNDSGIGDIGNSIAYDATLSNNDETLTIASGALVLTIVDNLSSSPIIGVWRRISGTEFNCLILFEDNTFLYAEKGGIVDSPEEDGLELGTYSFNQDIGNITFNITYDDNDPGNDSGVGDIGTPTVTNFILSNENRTLTIANGDLILTKEF